MTAPSAARSPRWLRVIMGLLAVSNLVTGLWAMISPANWFENFPGWAPALVGAYPPYNEHLATDAGAGLFASGLVMALAALWPRREVVITAAVAWLAFVLPHFVFHLVNPSDELTGAEDAANTFGLAMAVVGGALVLMWQWRRPPPVERTDA